MIGRFLTLVDVKKTSFYGIISFEVKIKKEASQT
jgi:hypothetical protein